LISLPGPMMYNCVLLQYHCIHEFFAADGSRKLMFFYQAMPVRACL